MAVQTLFTRFLNSLGVPHTVFASDEAFKGMTFKSLYGLSHLLNYYGIPNKGVKFTDKNQISTLTTPFLAQMVNGTFVIVLSQDDKTIEYDSRGEKLQIGLESFLKAWNGIALLAFPDEKSREPDYPAHRLTEIVSALAKYFLLASFLTVFIYLFVSRQLYAEISTILLTIFNCAGLYFSWLLVQKSLHIHTAASDKVCGVLEQGGCDSIMELKVSKLFGVFSWSEVGFGYFAVSLGTLLIFPELIPWLALFDVCCLPYTFWSIWYQRFRAHHWCTLCVGVQTTLWILFFCYLFGGWFKNLLPISPGIVILLATYIFAVTLLNQFFSLIKAVPCNEKNS